MLILALVVATFIPAAHTGEAVQEAIDRAAAAGGGRVVLERTTYPSGTLYFRSNVELHIPEGAVLLGGAKPEDYDDVDDPRIGKRPEKSTKVFLAAIACTNIAITGGGVIDGQGVGFYDANVPPGQHFKKPPHPRPRMLEVVRCRNIRVSDVTLKDSPGWTCWLRMCDDVAFERVKIHGDQRMINNDGIHVDGCRQVRVRGCDIRTGDDCVIMRAIRSPNGDSSLCEDMLVEDCTLSSACQCLRLGCPSDGTIRNGVFRNLTMRGRNGVMSGHPVRYLQAGDHGSCRMENLLVENCDIDVRASPISFWVDPGIALPGFGNTTFRHVRIKGGRPVTLRGSGDAVLKNVIFDDVAGTIGAEEPLAMKSVVGVVFKDFAVTSAVGEKTSPAVNEADGWERVR